MTTAATTGWLLLGALLGGLHIDFDRRLRRRGEVRLFAVYLFLAGVLYVAFAALSGAGARWTAVEGAGLVLFTLLAWSGLRRPAVLALGWLLHAVWDGALHLAVEQPVIGPWLPLLCLPFDLLAAAWLMYVATGKQPGTGPAPRRLAV